ncbi:MAG: SDR family NAD(P)-dependent oxidoreductase [Chloroflexi bacterium CFX1]|nr:SDR family NAD(P)-dependent oxidoreductase [Chloroflexi bacterium CFX1]MCQ3954815.1 NAD-dependent dehydratase [Chloroflexota bacterium]MDL1918201.1 SDR family NAD(P)-dependent oxidoreductase [Chloroflexi bacterium CFX5]
MNWNGKKVLVTGAGGFIASHLIERLASEGAAVRGFARYNSRNDLGMLKRLAPEVLSQVEIMQGDLRDTEAVRNAVRGADTVFHLGALIAIPYSYVNPREVFDVNINGTLNVLMAARDFGTRRVIHTSTSEVYGTAQYVPIDEKHPLQGQSPYSASKIGADRIAESFYRSFETPVVTLRPFNTFGPGQSMRAVIPTIIVQALTRDEVKLGSLEPSRDFTFVKDTADGFMKVAEAEGVLGEEINLGNDNTIRIGDLAEKIFKIIGKTPKIVADPQRVRPGKSEVMKLWASNEKAKRMIGWEPRVSLDEGLKLTIEWISAHLDLYRPDQYTV